MLGRLLISLNPASFLTLQTRLRAAETLHDGENRKDADLPMKPLRIGAKVLARLFRYPWQADSFVFGGCRRGTAGQPALGTRQSAGLRRQNEQRHSD